MIRKLLAALGPGIVFAATSIGVSHVVQSTRAGADFGYYLALLIVLAHLIKLPFFQMGPRYATATGESLLDAYQKIGEWAYKLFLLFTLSTMFIVQATVTIVAAGLITSIFDNGWSVFVWAAVLLLVVIGLLVTGGYRLLDRLLKVMMVIFALGCIVTLVAVLANSDLASTTGKEVDLLSAGSIAFMVALIGWMPTTIEVSVWHSFWVVEHNTDVHRESRRDQTDETLFDFNFSYLFCMVFALLFMVLGAKLLFGQGLSLSSDAVAFSAQLIGIFTQALGEWSKPVASVLIFVAMFSTCIAVADGFAQVITRAAEKHFHSAKSLHKRWHGTSVVAIALGGWIVIYLFAGQLKALVDFATTISFVAAPFFALLNIKAMHLPNVPGELRLNANYMMYTWACFASLLLFSGFYVVWRFF